LSAESKARISDALAGRKQTAEHRERIAVGQRARWERHYAEQVVALHGLVAKARTAKQRSAFEDAAHDAERRLARLRARRSSTSTSV
jgi:hypothetical protein